MTVALRLKAGGVLAMVVAGLLLGAAAATGMVPSTPPLLLGPAVGIVVAALTLIKLGAIAGAVLRFAVSTRQPVARPAA